jgi:hypothetical protein
VDHREEQWYPRLPKTSPELGGAKEYQSQPRLCGHVPVEYGADADAALHKGERRAFPTYDSVALILKVRAVSPVNLTYRAQS